MKKFILYDEDGICDHAKIVAIDDNHTFRHSGGKDRQANTNTNAQNVKSLSTVSAKIASSRFTATNAVVQNQPDGTDIMPMRVMTQSSVPDILIDSESMILDADNNNTPYDTINQNTISSLMNGGGRMYQRNLNQNCQNNQLTITTMKSVSICEDNNSIYDTITSMNRDSLIYCKSIREKCCVINAPSR